MSGWRVILIPFLILSVIGCAASVLVHLASFLPSLIEVPPAAFVLHIGIFICAIPLFILQFSDPRLKAFQRKKRGLFAGWKPDYYREYWKALAPNAPKWTAWATSISFGYAIFNFFFTLFVLPLLGAVGESSGPAAQTIHYEFRLFSGHWMAFYSMIAVFLYSQTHQQSRTGQPEEPQSFWE